MEETKSCDRRIAKTKKAIRNAFAELLAVKNINEITIKDVADCADISRKTFYYYYEGVWQVVDEIENEITSSFELLIPEISFNENSNAPYVIFEKLTTVINSDLDFYSKIFCSAHNNDLINKILSVLKEKMCGELLKQGSLTQTQLNFIADFCLSAMLSVFQNWFNSDRSQSITQLSDDLKEITFNGLNGYLRKISK